MAYKKSIKEKKDSGTYNVTRERGKANIEPVADITSIKKPDFLFSALRRPCKDY